MWDELVEARPEAPGVGVVRAASWLRVVPDVSAPVDVAEVLAEIDAGEAAAIAVALVRHADLLLIDDAAGRRAARRGVPRVGSRRRASAPGLGREPDFGWAYLSHRFADGREPPTKLSMSEPGSTFSFDYHDP